MLLFIPLIHSLITNISIQGGLRGKRETIGVVVSHCRNLGKIKWERCDSSCLLSISNFEPDIGKESCDEFSVTRYFFLEGENPLEGMNEVRRKGMLHDDDGNKSRGITAAIKQSMR